MKQQGAMIATVRTYLGVQDGTDAWIFLKYIVGIKKDERIIVDYLTGEEHSAIFRTEEGYIKTSRSEVQKGKVYAVECCDKILGNNELYSERQIKKFIRDSELFSDEYKALTKPKIMMKK